MTSLNISLPESLREWVDERVAKGGYSTASEYVRELIRDAQKEEADGRLETLLLEGLDSGSAGEMTKADWERLRSDARQRRTTRADA